MLLDLPYAVGPLLLGPLLALSGDRGLPPGSAAPAPGGPSLLAAGPDQEATSAARLTASALRDEAGAIGLSLAELAGALDAPDLEVRLASRAEVERRARAELERSFPEPRRTADERVAQLFGMLAPEDDLGDLLSRLLIDDLGGVHDRAAATVLVADDASLALARLVLAHELAQVLAGEGIADDEAAPTTDARLALQAVREARSMLLVSAWARENLAPADVAALLAEQAGRGATTGDLPPFVWKPILGLYSQGQAFLARQSRIGPLGATPRPTDIARAVSDPPSTTEELLHPERYWEPELREAPTPVEFDVGFLPEGWRVVHEDVLGELVLSILATPPDERRGLAASPLGVVGTRFSNPAADGWDGDRVIVVSDGLHSVARLAARFETALDASEFEAAVGRVFEALDLPGAILREDGFVVVTAGESEYLDELAAALTPRY